MKYRSALQVSRKRIIPEEVILKAVADYVPFDNLDEARSLYREAQSENKVAQFIVGMALRRKRHYKAAEEWLRLSGEQGFEPAIHQLKKVG